MREIRDFITELFVATFWRHRKLSNKYIFIWIPKNAGTSIYMSMRKKGMIKYKRLSLIKWIYKSNTSLTFGHISLDSLLDEGLVQEDDISKANLFTVLRDPFERFNSIYNYYFEKGIIDRYHQINSSPLMLVLLYV